MPTATPDAPRATQRRTARVLAMIAIAVLAGIVALVWWALSRSPEPPPAPPTAEQRFEPNREAWESAMAKAGVEATFPDGPVDIGSVRVQGLRPFSATFTAEEIGALLNVYSFETEVAGRTISLRDVVVAFPEAGVVNATAELIAEGSAYSTRLTLPLEHTPKGIGSPGATDLRVEGFSVGGARRQQASDAFVAYLNTYLRTAPGLIVERAEIVEGGLSVTGSAPQRLEHPAAAETPVP